MAIFIASPIHSSDAAYQRHPCPHHPTCPGAEDSDREAACPVARHPDQGWTLLCNGVVCFEDTGELLPDGRSIAPHRPTDPAGTRQGAYHGAQR